ncbi:hypothetical protein [Frigoriglobus tundricola]|uniref:Uncharacterized protein n=1 Tax=Frigoriglobus tundricola TaxID=2774151 RepID=A0A6M5YQN6_9BACT|nr:hypothetical protein [Frigoriglobus tundricola]QJW95730.1 hypothetical protein FTUN_3284 [Frigoriglobus tundricola]
MRALLAVFAVAVPGVASATDPPAKQVDPPYALLEFSGDRTLKQWTTTFEMTTASGATYELAIDFGDRSSGYANASVKAQLAANWVAEPTDNGNVRIYGVRTKEGKADAVKAMTATNRLRGGMGQMPILTGSGGATVKVKTDDGEAKPDPARKVPPRGPEFREETFVEFDLSTLPAGAKGTSWKLNWEIRTTAGKDEPWVSVPMEVTSVEAPVISVEVLDCVLPDSAFKAEAIGKTKIRVYGAVLGDRYYPAEKGSVTSPHLKPEQLPKITNPKRL